MRNIILVARYLFLCSLSLIINLNLLANSQTSTITGKVIDENEAPIPYASVAVYNSDKLITSAITNDKGVFTLKVEQSENEICLAKIDGGTYND